MTLYVTHLVLVMHFKRLISDIIQLQSVSTAAAALPAVTGEAVTDIQSLFGHLLLLWLGLWWTGYVQLQKLTV